LTGVGLAAWTTRTAGETREVGREIGAGLRAGDVVLLHGDLGAGKTTLTKGLAEALGVAEEIQSPTFTVVAEYPAPALGPDGWLVHVDLYRLAAGDLDSIGLDEVIDREDAVVVIEWPERSASASAAARLLVEFVQHGDVRTIKAINLADKVSR
jgi:tRNA threonylcarbamoyladenosine biosynthesis protein TsaE